MFSGGYSVLIAALVTMREQAGLTQRQLADRIGREQSFIGRIETRQRRIDLVEFCWWARCCGFDGEEELAKVTKEILKQIPKKPAKAKK